MDENDGKIYITISDKRFGRNEPDTPTLTTPGQADKEKDKGNPLADYAKHQFFSLIKSQATQAVNYTISNIGNFTGNYVSQMHTQDSVNLLNTLINYGTSAYAGFKMTGSPIGALVAVGIQAIGSGITKVEELYAGYVQNARQNYAIAQLRTRAGLNSNNNGSRGTDQ